MLHIFANYNQRVLFWNLISVNRQYTSFYVWHRMRNSQTCVKGKPDLFLNPFRKKLESISSSWRCWWSFPERCCFLFIWQHAVCMQNSWRFGYLSASKIIGKKIRWHRTLIYFFWGCSVHSTYVSQKIINGSWFFPSSMWVPGIELSLSSNYFILWATPAAHRNLRALENLGTSIKIYFPMNFNSPIYSTFSGLTLFLICWTV